MKCCGRTFENKSEQPRIRSPRIAFLKPISEALRNNPKHLRRYKINVIRSACLIKQMDFGEGRDAIWSKLFSNFHQQSRNLLINAPMVTETIKFESRTIA